MSLFELITIVSATHQGVSDDALTLQKLRVEYAAGDPLPSFIGVEGVTKLRICKMAFQHAQRIRGTVKMLDIWQAAKVHGYDRVEFSATQQPSLHTAHPA